MQPVKHPVRSFSQYLVSVLRGVFHYLKDLR